MTECGECETQRNSDWIRGKDGQAYLPAVMSESEFA
jgi:hypothetical protein